jgi:hypothetical protein
MREFFLMFGVQSLQYFLITVNLRAASQGLYFWTAVSDMLCAANGFFLIKRVAESKSKLGFAGYVLGGATGSIIGIWLSKMVYGA